MVVIGCIDPNLNLAFVASRGRKLRLEWQSPAADRSADLIKRANWRWFNPLLLPSFISLWFLLWAVSAAPFISQTFWTVHQLNTADTELNHAQAAVDQMRESTDKASLNAQIKETRRTLEDRKASSPFWKTGLQFLALTLGGFVIGMVLIRLPFGHEVARAVIRPLIFLSFLYDKLFPAIQFDFPSTDGAYYSNGVRWSVILAATGLSSWIGFR